MSKTRENIKSNKGKATNNNQWITEEKKIIDLSLGKQKHDNPKRMGCSKSRDVYSNTILPQGTRKKLNNLTLHLQQPGKEQTTPKLVEGKKS